AAARQRSGFSAWRGRQPGPARRPAQRGPAATRPRPYRHDHHLHEAGGARSPRGPRQRRVVVGANLSTLLRRTSSDASPTANLPVAPPPVLFTLVYGP